MPRLLRLFVHSRLLVEEVDRRLAVQTVVGKETARPLVPDVGHLCQENGIVRESHISLSLSLSLPPSPFDSGSICRSTPFGTRVRPDWLPRAGHQGRRRSPPGSRASRSSARSRTCSSPAQQGRECSMTPGGRRGGGVGEEVDTELGCMQRMGERKYM